MEITSIPPAAHKCSCGNRNAIVSIHNGKARLRLCGICYEELKAIFARLIANESSK